MHDRPIFQAITRMYLGLVSSWVNDHNADVTKTNKNGETPLQVALNLTKNYNASTSKLQIIKALLTSPQYTNGTTDELKKLLENSYNGDKKYYNLIKQALDVNKPEMDSNLKDNYERIFDAIENLQPDRGYRSRGM